MGYDRHYAIVVTSWSEPRTIEAHDKATELGMIVTPVTATPLNGYNSFMVCPDGSKRGWPEAAKGDKQRQAFIDWLENGALRDDGSYLKWAEVQYGDDDRQTLVTRSNEEIDRVAYLRETSLAN
jgi:hypothetical protein